MKQLKLFKSIALISYLLIMLMGQLIAIPFFFWLVVTLFDFGNADKLFALLGVAGLVISLVNRNKKRKLKILLLDIACLLLMASPLVRRMTVVPIHLFDYWAFKIPATIFVSAYLISLAFSIREYNVANAQSAA